MTSVDRNSSDLAQVVELAASAHGYDAVEVTDEGEPVAFVLSPEEWWSIRETLDVLLTPGSAERLDESIAQADQGQEIDGTLFLARFRGSPPA